MKEAKERPEGLQLPEKNTTMKHVFAYLTKSRGIDSRIVQEYVDNGQLYESKENNCVFVGKNSADQPAYAFIRGTNTQYRFLHEAQNSKKEISFSKQGETKRLFVFESIIDLMSYQTLLKLNNCKEELKAHFLSLGGVEDVALAHYLSENVIEKITLCLDNDEQGRKGCQRISEKYKDEYKVTRHKPHSKDFNADLTEMREQEREIVNEKNLEEEMELFSEP